MPARFRRGDHTVRCDRSGFIVNASDCKMMWNGLFVRKDLWEPRHPLDRAAPALENRTPLHARPSGEDQFISATDVTADDL
jgi:hypothetical protein